MATPPPIVSMRYLFDVADDWCVKVSPTVRLTSVKCTSGAGAAARKSSSEPQTPSGVSRLLPSRRTIRDASSLLDHDEAVGGQIPQRVFGAGWPDELDNVRLHCRTKPEMEAEVVLRIVARPAHDLVDLGPPSRGQPYACANGGAVGLAADTLHLQPVVAVPAFVPE